VVPLKYVVRMADHRGGGAGFARSHSGTSSSSLVNLFVNNLSSNKAGAGYS
jgi:hypothetical protein